MLFHTSNKQKIASYFLLVVGVAFFLAATLLFGTDVSAQIGEPGDTFGVEAIENTDLQLGGGDIRVIIAQIIRAVLGLLGIIALSIIVYAGYIIMTSQGNEERIAMGRKLIINAAIGLAIIMSAFAIASFVINALGRATGALIDDNPPTPAFSTFAGTGALGSVVSDHYPFRDQEDVARNTKISVTFREPIDPSTIIANTNRTCIGDGGESVSDPAFCDPDGDGNLNRLPYFGDCLYDEPDFNWVDHCDHLHTEAIQIFKQEDAVGSPADLPLVTAAAMTTYQDGSERNAYTFTIRPFDVLGDSLQPVGYTVDLTDNILNKNGEEVFDGNDDPYLAGDQTGYYAWDFFTGTELDFDPPVVSAVTPAPGTEAPKNTIVQIIFNEAMDPVQVQGLLNDDVDPFTNVIFHTTGMTGEWRISSGYTTIEFIPTQQCGINSCGDAIYCLEVNCTEDDAECVTPYTGLGRTAALVSGDSWEAVPFTGIMDMAGNALDGDPDGARDGKPPLPGELTEIGDFEDAPDNYYWSFNIRNEIDLTTPYVHHITPGVDEQNVDANAPLSITFSTKMQSLSLADLGLVEHPANAPIIGPEGEVLGNVDDIWHRSLGVLVTVDTDGSADTEEFATRADVAHREFGPNDLDLYYFPSVPGTVKSLTQNCMYPGRGPAAAGEIVDGVEVSSDGQSCVFVEDGLGGTTAHAGCGIPTGFTDVNDSGCAHTDPGAATVTDTLESCVETLLPGISNRE